MTGLLLNWNLTHASAIRAIFCGMAIVFAFFLFVVTDAVAVRLANGEVGAEQDRLIVVHKYALSESLPAAYRERIIGVPGVRGVTPRQILGGWFRDPTVTFTQYVVDPEQDLALHPEYRVAEDARRDFLSGGNRVLIGKDLAARFGWRVGENISLGSIWLGDERPDGFNLTVAGIFDGGSGLSGHEVNTDVMLLNYKYFAEQVPFAKYMVGWFVVALAPGANASEVSKQIDTMFENDNAPTMTSTERAFSQRMARQLGDVTRISVAVSFAVFLSLAFATSLYFWQNMGERAEHVDVLRAIGFSDRQLFLRIWCGALALCGGAALIGVLCARACIPLAARELQAMLPGIQMPLRTYGLAFILMFLLSAAGTTLACVRIRGKHSPFRQPGSV